MKPCTTGLVLVTAVPSLTLGLLASSRARAADEAGIELPLWELGIGAAAFHQPNYPGSDVRTTSALFEFAEDGHVLYHPDYWDASQLYEQIAVAGRILGFLREKMSPGDKHHK